MTNKPVTVIKKFSQDTGEYTIISEVFNRIITEYDYYDILSHYKEKPNWLNFELIKNGRYRDPETLEEYIMTQFQIVDLGD